MTADVEKAAERLNVKVTLNVVHRVTVTLTADSTQSMEELKAAALAEFHRNPRGYGAGKRTDDTWRAQFGNRTNIDVGSEQVSIAAVSTTPKSESWS